MVSTGLAACGEPTQLYIAHNTVVGVDVAVDTNRQAGRLVVGYDRQFVALAPKSVPPDPEKPDPDCVGEPDCREAMAVLSCNEVEVDGIFLTRFKDRLATGTAAKKAATKIVEHVQTVAQGDVTKYAEIAAGLFDCWRPIETDEDGQ
jgi:hypothetical protein